MRLEPKIQIMLNLLMPGSEVVLAGKPYRNDYGRNKSKVLLFKSRGL